MGFRFVVTTGTLWIWRGSVCFMMWSGSNEQTISWIAVAQGSCQACGRQQQPACGVPEAERTWQSLQHGKAAPACGCRCYRHVLWAYTFNPVLQTILFPGFALILTSISLGCSNLSTRISGFSAPWSCRWIWFSTNNSRHGQHWGWGDCWRTF